MGELISNVCHPFVDTHVVQLSIHLNMSVCMIISLIEKFLPYDSNVASQIWDAPFFRRMSNWIDLQLIMELWIWWSSLWHLFFRGSVLWWSVTWASFFDRESTFLHSCSTHFYFTWKLQFYNFGVKIQSLVNVLSQCDPVFSASSFDWRHNELHKLLNRTPPAKTQMRFFFLGPQQTKKERNCHCDYSVYLKCVAATLSNRFPILFPIY